MCFREGFAWNMGCCIDAVRESIAFGVIPLARFISIEFGASREVLACKLFGVSFFLMNPRGDGISIFMQSWFGLVPVLLRFLLLGLILIFVVGWRLECAG